MKNYSILRGALAFALGLALATGGVVLTARAQGEAGYLNTTVGPYVYKHISTAATTVVKAGVTVLHTLTINLCVANATIGVYDSATTNANAIAVITCPATVTNPVSLEYDVQATNGVTIVTSGNTDETVSTE